MKTDGFSLNQEIFIFFPQMPFLVALYSWLLKSTHYPILHRASSEPDPRPVFYKMHSMDHLP